MCCGNWRHARQPDHSAHCAATMQRTPAARREWRFRPLKKKRRSRGGEQRTRASRRRTEFPPPPLVVTDAIAGTRTSISPARYLAQKKAATGCIAQPTAASRRATFHLVATQRRHRAMRASARCLTPPHPCPGAMRPAAPSGSRVPLHRRGQRAAGTHCAWYSCQSLPCNRQPVVT